MQGPAKADYFKAIGYEPHAAQWEYHTSMARFRIPCCGRRMGKTLMAARDHAPKLFEPNTRGWIVGPVYDLAEKEFRVLWNDLIVDQQFGKIKRSEIPRAYNLRTGEMFIEMPWGSRVEVRSAAHPDKLVGDELDWIILSEAAKHSLETWQRYLRPALSDRRGVASFPSTAEGFNWYYKLWQIGQDPDVPEYQSWKFPSWLNHYQFPDGYEDSEIQLLLRTMDEQWFLQEIAADFASFVGRIYAEFNEAVHVKKHEFNPAWPNYGTWDWGFANPRAFVEFQVSPDEDIYVWRESVEQYKTLGEHIEILKKREDPDGYHLDLTFGDAADPEAVEYATQNFAFCIGDPAAKTNWRQGIELVKRFLRSYHDGISYDDQERPITKPKYFVDHSCKEHIREMNNYKSKENVEGKTESNTIGVAEKKDDHTVDAVRYGIMSVFELGYSAESDADKFINLPKHQHQQVERDDNDLTVADILLAANSGHVTQNVRF